MTKKICPEDWMKKYLSNNNKGGGHGIVVSVVSFDT